jgi:hypothetical protein
MRGSWPLSIRTIGSGRDFTAGCAENDPLRPACSTTSSTKLFQDAHPGHFPIHFGDS